MFLKECEYIFRKKKVNRHITEDLKVSSDSDGFYGSDSLINGQKSFPSMKNCTV